MATAAQQSTQNKDEPEIEVKEEAKAETKAEAKPEPKPAAKDESASRVGRANAIIRRNVLWALGAGIVPIPVVDAIAVSGVQVRMLQDLSDLYGSPFREDAAKKIIGTLLAGLGGVAIGTVLSASVSKLIPGVGTVLGMVTVPLAAGAFTHTTGKVFLMHFESGGTLLDFDPHAMRAYFKQEFEKAKEVVASVQEQERAKSTAKPS